MSSLVKRTAGGTGAAGKQNGLQFLEWEAPSLWKVGPCTTELWHPRELVVERPAQQCGDVGDAVAQHLAKVHPAQAQPLGLVVAQLVPAQPMQAGFRGRWCR